MLLDWAGVALEVHANPGHVDEDQLAMTWPVDSPYFSPETGIDKAAVVREALGAGGPVAFAGDGPPDLVPALLVPPRLRFARGTLAKLLAERGEPFQPFDRWTDVARAVVGKAVDHPALRRPAAPSILRAAPCGWAGPRGDRDVDPPTACPLWSARRDRPGLLRAAGVAPLADALRRPL